MDALEKIYFDEMKETLDELTEDIRLIKKHLNIEDEDDFENEFDDDFDSEDKTDSKEIEGSFL